MLSAFEPRDDADGFGCQMANSTYFRQQVERCLRLARMCSDNTVAERLQQMATEFQEQADRLADAMVRNNYGTRESNRG